MADRPSPSVPAAAGRDAPMGAVLRDARLRADLSQQALAAKLGLRQRQISDLERGTVDSRLSTIQNVARALDLELMLVPRPLLTTVESLQRSDGTAGATPLYALDAGVEASPETVAPVELGDARARPAVVRASSSRRRDRRR